jgi:hypothetical protein
MTDVCLETPLNMTQDGSLTIKDNAADNYFCALINPLSNLTDALVLPPVRMPGIGRQCPLTCPTTLTVIDQSFQNNLWLVLVVLSLLFVCFTSWDTHVDRWCARCGGSNRSGPKRGCFVGANQRLVI